MEVGTPGQGQKKKKNYFYVKQGTQSFRILPPLGNLAKAGVWSKYYEVHFGYKNDEGFMRPFQSCEVKNRTNRQMIEVTDAAAEKVKKLEDQLKQVKERLKSNPTSELRAVAAKLEKLVGFEDGQFSLEKRHYLNAINEKGEIGLLSIKHKEKLALEAARTQIQSKYGLDPIGVDGCFIEFSKSGKSFETLISARGAMIVQPDQSEKLNKHTLDQTLIGRLEDEAFELDSLYAAPTQEEIQEIVAAYDKNEKEGQAAVTRVFKRLQPDRESKQKTEANPVSKPVSKPVNKSESKAVSKVQTVVEEADLSMKEELQAQADTSTNVETAAQSDDDFLKSIGAS